MPRGRFDCCRYKNHPQGGSPFSCPFLVAWETRTLGNLSHLRASVFLLLPHLLLLLLRRFSPVRFCETPETAAPYPPINGQIRTPTKSFDSGCCSSYAAAAAKSRQSCPTLCNPIDGSPPGSPIPGILQARTLEWVAISFSNA